MARKLKITENEKYTLEDVKYGEVNCLLQHQGPFLERARVP